MKKLPNFVKWLIIAVVLAAMAAMMVAVNDRASRVEMPMPDNSLGIYRQTPATGKFVRYQEGAEKYSLGLTKFQELAKEAKAVYKIDKVALVNCEIFERYLETFRIA